MLRALNSSIKAAHSWVHDNVTRYVSSARTGLRIDYVHYGAWGNSYDGEIEENAQEREFEIMDLELP
ncbi:hypothetical protein L484_000850 [Morus notabilis]|uniref:Uncharacterized protein n=1 Tax=Morus notabilis TaxID=981085 RepID=W9RWZ5_9ROSA|nr:hypothetical protein L484_000850 [Morus notabilis]